MPFPSPLSSPQKTTLRASGYWARVLVALNTNEVVFRARANETIDSQPFIEFDYDGVDIGSFSAVWPGMVCYISATDDIRDAKYRGRVRLDPTSSVFKIDENATILNDGDRIIVTRDTDLFSRIRRDTLVDGSITYHDLPPTTDGLPYVTVLYDADNDGSVTWTPVQTGVPVDAAATTIDTWAWSVSGAGTSSIDDDTAQNPTFTFQAGYHYLVRVVYEDDNGEENYQIVHVYAVTRTFSAPVVQAVVTGSIQGDREDGWTASLTAYADVSTLLDRTHCAVFSVERFGDNSSTPIVSNVLMNGRIRSDSIQTEGNAEAGRVQQVTFAVEGITAYLRRLRIPNDIVRATASPDAWGEITAPNPFRMSFYALWAYTTLTNLGSFSVEDGAFEAYEIGAEPRGIDGGSALDVLTGLLDTIKAAPNYAPTGEIFLAQTVSYLADRSGVETITTFDQQDMREYTVDRDSSRTTAQVIAFGGVYNSTANTWTLYTAQAPSIVYGDGGEPRELTREILTADSTIAEAQEEIGGRASNDFAYNNPKPLLRMTLFDSHAGVLIPTNFQRWVATIDASTNTLGIAYGASDYWQLQSISLTIDANGTIDVSGEWPAETTFNDAQILASLLPNNLSNMNPVLPVLPNDPAFPTDPLENYPTDTPGLDELAPIDPDSASQAYTPFPPDVASQVAQKQGKVGCKVLQPLFSNSSNAESTWTTVLNDPYLLTVEGFAGIETTDSACSDEDKFSVGTVTDHTGNVFTVDAEFTGILYRVTWGLNVDGADCCNVDLIATSGSISSGTVVDCEGVSISFGDLPADIRYLNADSASPFTLEMTITGGGSSGVYTRFADAFYSFQRNDEGEEINVQALGPSEGLFIDNSLYTPLDGFPPPNPSHRYEKLRFTGTGNILRARTVFDSYSAVQKAYLTIEVCRVIS